MELDRAAILSAMYQDTDPNDAETSGTIITASPGRTLLTRRVRVGAIEYELPSVEYVQHLEKLITQQTEIVAQQRRMIDRLSVALNRTRTAQQLHRLNLDSMQRDLNNKVTLRSSAET
jgi:hypothetical protein